MMIIGIETSTPSGGIALFDGERILASQLVTSARAHSRLILPALQMILHELKLKIDDVDAIAVSRGPGSFTGVRVGLSLGKALCESGHPKLVTVSSLEALAWRAYAGEEIEYVLPLMNARQGEVYGAWFPASNGAVGKMNGEEFVMSPEKILLNIPGKCLLAGEGMRAFKKQWIQNEAVSFARPDRSHPSPVQVAMLGARLIESGTSDDPATASPIYLREPIVNRPKKSKDNTR